MSIKFLSGINVDNNVLFVDDVNNRVGIGTGSPADTLTVNGTFRSNSLWTTSSGITQWGAGSTAYGTLTWDTGYARIHATSGNRLDLGASGGLHMTISTTGNVGIGTTSPVTKLEVDGTVTISGPSAIKWKYSDNYAYFGIGYISAANYGFYNYNYGRADLLFTQNTGAATFSSSVTATSLIKVGGTSAQYLMADGSVSTLTNPVTGTGTTNYVPKFTSASAIGNSALQEVSGNLGLGVTPSAWQTDVKAIQIGDVGSNICANNGAYSGANNVWINNNSFQNSSVQDIYTRTATAGQYNIQGNTHIWRIAPSGTAGDAISFTQAMTLDASGNLLVGGTSPYGATITSYASATRSGGIGIRNSAGTAAGFFGTYAAGSGGGSTDITVESAGFMIFASGGSERMRITAAGNVLINTTTDSGYKLGINGSLSTTYANVYDPTSWSVVNIAASSAGVSASTHYSPYGTVSGTNPVFCTGQKFSEHGNYSIWRYNGSSHLATDFAINNSGAATFSSSVTASSLIKSGGTSSQYLMADGSVSTTSNVAPRYMQTINVSQTAYTTICTVTGGSLASAVNMSFQGTSGNVVVNVTAQILVNHFQDISITTTSGFYSQLNIRVISNNNETYSVEAQVQSGVGASTDLNIEVFPLNSESVTFGGSPVTPGTTLVHSTRQGLYVSASEPISISSSGDIYAGANVGVGTTNTDPLSLGRERNLAIVTTGTNAALTLVGGGAGRIDFGVGSTRTAGIYSDASNYTEIFTTTALPLVFSTNSAEKMRITSAGNVGIGTTSPSQALHVSGSLRVTGAYYDSSNSAGSSGQVLSSTGSGTDWVSLSEISGVDGTGTANYVAKWSDADTIANSQIVDNGTNVGINNATPKTKLDVNGAIGFGSKTLNISDTFVTVLTVNMSNHTGCYVKITAFGDWSGHSAVAYLGEFFLQNGASAYNEPGVIIRQVDNTNTDDVVAQIVDPAGTGTRDFEIQLKTTSASGVPFSAAIQYEVRGQYNSVS